MDNVADALASLARAHGSARNNARLGRQERTGRRAHYDTDYRSDAVTGESTRALLGEQPTHQPGS